MPRCAAATGCEPVPCASPLKAWRSRSGGITFKPGDGTGLELRLPCGQCLLCRLEKSQQWAIRIVHESRLHSWSTFATLTYNDDSLPHGGTLVKRHLQLFFKRLRKAGNRVRYYAVGEYGDNTRRPHYHAIIFGYWPGDGRFLKHNRHGHKLYESAELSALWGFGHVTYGAVEPGSAEYTARYTIKKLIGNEDRSRLEVVYPETGELVHLEPEFAIMSRRPGIGAGFLDRYQAELYPSDHAILDARKAKLPRYYDDRLEAIHPALHASVKAKRLRRAHQLAEQVTPERLLARATIKKASLNKRRDVT